MNFFKSKDSKKNCGFGIQNLLKLNGNKAPGSVYPAVAQSLKVSESAVKCVDVEEKEKLKKSKGVKSFEEFRKDVYNEVCKLQNKKKFKDNEKKILPKIAKNLHCSIVAVRDSYSNELMSMASKDASTFYKTYYNSSLEIAEQNMIPKPTVYIWTHIVLSFLKIEDNFGFSCNRADHEKNKMKFKLSPCMLKKSNMLTHIIKHVETHHGFQIDDFKNLTSGQIKRMKQDFEVDQEVLRRFNFLNWTFENSPKALAHVIAVIKRPSTSEHPSLASPINSKQTSKMAKREWISDGVDYISLKQMPLDIQRFQVQPQPQTKLAALTPELVAQLKPALPKNASRKVEMAVAMSVPHVFFQMYNSETALANCFRVLETIEKHLFQHEQVNPIRMADIYHIFGKPSSTSAIDYLDMILYAGFETDETRLFAHANQATVAFKNRAPLDNQELHQHIANFWNNGHDVFFGKLRKCRTKTQGYFAEYAVISFLRSLAHNHNQNHGTTTPFKWLLESYDITHEMIAKIGAALLINYHKNEKIVFHCMQPIPFDRSISKPNDARLTMTELLTDVTIPSFRLNDTNVKVKDHCSYILHLFVALFTIRARLARYHLMDSSFLAGLLAEDISSFEEAYDLIESVLLQTQWTAYQCVEWAYGIWKRVFVTNVQAANAQSSKVPLYPASKKTFQISVDFVTSAALLLIHCVTARDFPGEDRIQEAAANMLLEHPRKRPDPLPQYFTVSRFSDLQNIEPLSKTRQLSDLPSIRFADWVDPVEPYHDMVQTTAFLVAGAQLRTFNFTGSLIGKSSVEPKHEFKFPVFHGSLNFVKLI